MKENIKKFDLEAAFKALDEIEAPKVKGIRPNVAYITEKVQRHPNTDCLLEDYEYDVSSQEDLGEAAEERNGEIAKAKLARIEKIVDLDADSPDELQQNYVGKTIIQCPQCMTMFYKDAEDLEASEDDPNTVNVGEVCQHCGYDGGYTLIGKVGKIEADEVDNFETTEDDLNFSEEQPAEELPDEIPDELPEEGAEEEVNFDEIPDELPEEPANESLNVSTEAPSDYETENGSEKLTLNEDVDGDEEELTEANIFTALGDLFTKKAKTFDQHYQSYVVVCRDRSNKQEVKRYTFTKYADAAKAAKSWSANPQNGSGVIYANNADDKRKLSIYDSGKEITKGTSKQLATEFRQEDRADKAFNKAVNKSGEAAAEELPEVEETSAAVAEPKVEEPKEETTTTEVTAAAPAEEPKAEEAPKAEGKKLSTAEAEAALKAKYPKLTPSVLKILKNAGLVESLNTSEVQKEAEEGSELKTENESENLTLNEGAFDEIPPAYDEESPIEKGGNIKAEKIPVTTYFLDCSGSWSEDRWEKELAEAKALAARGNLVNVFYFSDKLYTNKEDAFKGGTSNGIIDIINYAKAHPEERCIVRTDDDYRFQGGEEIEKLPNIELRLRKANEELQEDVDKDLDKKLKAHNDYIAYLQQQIKQEEEALKNCTNEEVKAAIQRRLDAFQEDLKAALPDAVKEEAPEIATDDGKDLPTPEETNVEEDLSDDEVASIEEVAESLTEDVNLTEEGNLLDAVMDSEEFNKPVDEKDIEAFVNNALADGDVKEDINITNNDSPSRVDNRGSDLVDEDPVDEGLGLFGIGDVNVNLDASGQNNAVGVGGGEGKNEGLECEGEACKEGCCNSEKKDEGLLSGVAGLANGLSKGIEDIPVVGGILASAEGEKPEENKEPLKEDDENPFDQDFDEPKDDEEEPTEVQADEEPKEDEEAKEDEEKEVPEVNFTNDEVKDIAKDVVDEVAKEADADVEKEIVDEKVDEIVDEKAEEKAEEIKAEEESGVEAEPVEGEEPDITDEPANDLDFDFEDFDESAFNEHINEFLQEVYSNVKGFATTDCKLHEGKLIVEGQIYFNSGKQKTSSFEFTPKKVNNVLFFEGYNKDFASDKAFTLNCKLTEAKEIITESVGYNYKIGESLVEGLK